jgi:uncharacterized phage protein gp47/JayE
MAFQIKDFTSITASMINWMKVTTKKVSDYNIGSVVRSMLEAVAAEIDELYQQFFNGITEAIPRAVYLTFGFDSLAAVSASGLCRVTIASSTTQTVIPAGTTFIGDGLTSEYISGADTIITPGDTFADVLITATTSGIVGNIAAGVNFTLTPAPAGFVSAANLSRFINGLDVESDDDKELRFADYISSLDRGTVTAIEFGLKTTQLTDASGNPTERVVSAVVIEPWVTDSTQPISYVECYIHNGVGNTSSALLALATQIVYGYTDANNVKIPGWKAAGVTVDVFIATEQLIPVTATLTALAGFDKPTLVTAAEQAVFTYIQSLDIGETAIYSKMVELVMDIAGVYDFDPSAPVPGTNTTAARNVKLMPGAIAIT